MQKNIFKALFIIISIINFLSSAFAQEERKVSFTTITGVALFPNDKKNNADLSTRVLGGYNPTPVLGLGINYKLSKHLKVGEHYMIFFNTNSENRKLSAQSFRTLLKYNFLVEKKISPYLVAGININRLSINREASERSFIPDPANNTDIIGQGISVDSIYYREKELKLQGLPVLGTTLGAGFEFKISKKINAYLQYDVNANRGKKNNLIEEYYSSNESNFLFHSITGGINIKLFKPQKQLLAVLKKDDWKNSYSIDVRGTIIYKKPNKPANKVIEVELTDTLENPQKILSTEQTGIYFVTKGVETGDYQFMLPKKNKKIVRADLQILNYNRIKIEDDDLELEMVEDENSENILSRDGNFAVMLREGFQHEIELSTTAENIMGKFTPLDNNCRVRITLKDQYDSVIAYIDTMNVDNTFNFVDIPPGNYKMSFQKLNEECNPTEFLYSFTGAYPFIKRQSNSNLPEDTVVLYSIKGNVKNTSSKPEAPKGTVVKLIDPSGRVENSTDLGGPKTEFAYNNLKSPKYDAVFEEPTNKASMNYKVKDKKSNVIREVKSGPNAANSKKTTNTNYQVKGSIEFPNPENAKNITVLLIDSTGKVKQKLPIQPDGSFNFDNLDKNKYKVAYQSSDPLLKGKLKYKTIDKNLKVNKVVLNELTSIVTDFDTIHFYKKEAGTTITETPPIKTPVVSSTENTPVKKEPIVAEKPVVKNEPTTTPPIEKPVIKTENKSYNYGQFEAGNTYDNKGNIVNPAGYGVQVSSFFVTSNLEKFCQRLISKGEKEIYIQVVAKEKDNPAAGLIYRVILGADADREKMLRRVPEVQDEGYENAVLKRHLD